MYATLTCLYILSSDLLIFSRCNDVSIGNAGADGTIYRSVCKELTEARNQKGEGENGSNDTGLGPDPKFHEGRKDYSVFCGGLKPNFLPQSFREHAFRVSKHRKTIHYVV